MTNTMFKTALAALTIATALYSTSADAKRSKHLHRHYAAATETSACPSFRDDRYPCVETRGTASKTRSDGRNIVAQPGGGDGQRLSYRHTGACDGFHRCRCGTTAARHFGLAYDHNGMNLKKASEWYGFQRTSFRIGAAGVVPHHVLAIVGGSSCSNATVSDDAGTYQRNVCHMTFVEPGSSGRANSAGYSARRHHASHRHHRRYASR